MLSEDTAQTGLIGGTPVKLYPEVPARRTTTIARDVATLLLVVLFVWIGVGTYRTVDRLTVLGKGVVDAGTTVQSGFDSVAGAMGSVPIVGGNLATALEGVGSGTGGQLATLGQKGVDSVHRLAIVLGLLVFGVPTLLVLLVLLPGRIRQVRQLTAASAVLANPDDPDRHRLLAMRAAFGLPYGRLLAYTTDPLGDLATGHYEDLVAAALDDAGLLPPPRGGGGQEMARAGGPPS
jgi:hypothetical protein